MIRQTHGHHQLAQGAGVLLRARQHLLRHILEQRLQVHAVLLRDRGRELRKRDEPVGDLRRETVKGERLWPDWSGRVSLNMRLARALLELGT